MLILTFIMNLFDFYIVDKYYYCFSKERKRNTFFSITTLVASAFVLSIVNAIGYPIANLIRVRFYYGANWRTIAGFLFGDFSEPIGVSKLFYFCNAMRIDKIIYCNNH